MAVREGMTWCETINFLLGKVWLVKEWGRRIQCCCWRRTSGRRGRGELQQETDWGGRLHCPAFRFLDIPSSNTIHLGYSNPLQSQLDSQLWFMLTFTKYLLAWLICWCCSNLSLGFQRVETQDHSLLHCDIFGGPTSQCDATTNSPSGTVGKDNHWHPRTHHCFYCRMHERFTFYRFLWSFYVYRNILQYAWINKNRLQVWHLSYFSSLKNKTTHMIISLYIH